MNNCLFGNFEKSTATELRDSLGAFQERLCLDGLNESISQIARFRIKSYGNTYKDKIIFYLLKYFFSDSWVSVDVQDKSNRTQQILVNINSVSKRLGISRTDLKKEIQAGKLIERIQLQVQFIQAHYDKIEKLTNSKAAISLVDSYQTIIYAEAHKEDWSSQLDQTGKESLYLRHEHTFLPYTLEYFKNGEILLHTKMGVSSGNNKKVKLSIAIETTKLYAKAVPHIKNESAFQSIQDEGRLLAKYKGVEGIVQLEFMSTYSSRKKDEHEKIALYTELYTCDLKNSLNDKQKKFNNAEIQMMVTRILNGFAALHQDRLFVGDIKPRNVLVQINSETNEIEKVDLCDLGSAEEFQDEGVRLTRQKDDVNQTYLNLFQEIFRKKLNDQCPIPPVLLKMVRIDASWLGCELKPQEPCTAEQANQEAKQFYQSLSS